MAISRRELSAAAYISLSAGFVLAGYSAVRNASSTLFKEAYGANSLPLLMAVMPLGVLAVLYVYARLLSALGPRPTLWMTTLGSGALIAALYGAIRLEAFHPSMRLARAALRVFSDAYIALLIAAGSLLPAANLSDRAYRIAGEPRGVPQPPIVVGERRAGRSPSNRGGLALHLFSRNPLLVAILAMVLATQVLATVLDLNYQTVLQNVIPQRDPQTQWAARFEALLNLLAAFMQFVAAPLLLRFVPVAAILIAMPLIQMAAAGVSVANPSLRFAAGAYVVFKMFDYSLFKAAKETLYIPLSYDARYRAKEVIGVLGYRAAKGVTSAVIALFERFGAAVSRAYAPVALAAAAAWAVAVARRAAASRESVAPPSDSPAFTR